MGLVWLYITTPVGCCGRAAFACRLNAYPTFFFRCRGGGVGDAEEDWLVEGNGWGEIKVAF